MMRVIKTSDRFQCSIDNYCFDEMDPSSVVFSEGQSPLPICNCTLEIRSFISSIIASGWPNGPCNMSHVKRSSGSGPGLSAHEIPPTTFYPRSLVIMWSFRNHKFVGTACGSISKYARLHGHGFGIQWR